MIINLLILINNQIIFPDVLKISKVIPIYKKCDVSLLSNYISTSLLSTHNYFVDNSLLTEHQFGFRAKYSTELATIRLVDYINKEMDKNTPVNLYSDLLKTFDTINFELLLYKIRYYGVLGTDRQLTARVPHLSR